MKPVELVALLRAREERYLRELPGLALQRRTILLRVAVPIGWEPVRPYPPVIRVSRLCEGRVLGRIHEGDASGFRSFVLAEFPLDPLLDAALELATKQADESLPLYGEADNLEIEAHEVFKP